MIAIQGNWFGTRSYPSRELTRLSFPRSIASKICLDKLLPDWSWHFPGMFNMTCYTAEKSTEYSSIFPKTSNILPILFWNIQCKVWITSAAWTLLGGRKKSAMTAAQAGFGGCAKLHCSFEFLYFPSGNDRDSLWYRRYHYGAAHKNIRWFWSIWRIAYDYI